MADTNESVSEACLKVASFDELPEEESDLVKYAALVIGIITVFLVLSSVLIFWFYRRRFLRLKQRNFPMLLAFSFGVLCYTAQVSFRDYYGPADFPCDIYALIAFLSPFFLLMPLGSIALSLYHRVLWNKAVLELTFGSVAKGDINAFHQRLQNSERSESTDNEEQEIALDRDVITMTLRRQKLGNRKNKKTEEQTSKCSFFQCIDSIFNFYFDRFTAFMYRIAKFLYPFFLFLSCWKHPKHIPKQLQFRYFFASQTFSKLFCFIIFVFYFATAFTYYIIVFEPFQGCLGCGIARLYPVQIPFNAIFIVLCISVTKWNWQFPDALEIKVELKRIVQFYVLYYLCLLNLLIYVTDNPEEKGEWDWSLVSQLLLSIFVVYIMPIQVIKAHREAKIVTSNNLNDILASEDGSKAFALHLATELCLENLYFYKGATAWTRQFKAHPQDEEIFIKANEIVQLYVIDGAPFQINISAGMRKIILHNVQNNLNVNLFDEALQETFNLMAADPFFRFQKSKYFVAYQNTYAAKNASSFSMLTRDL